MVNPPPQITDPTEFAEGGPVFGPAHVQPAFPSDDWTRFDLWADRAWDMAERAIEAARQVDNANLKAEFESDRQFSDSVHALMSASVVAQGLASAAAPVTDVDHVLQTSPAVFGVPGAR